MVITRRALVERLRHAAPLIVLPLAACGGQPKQIAIGPPAPNPSGCYVFVYERTDFNGLATVLNGPGRWFTLERVQADQVDWRNRIRSLDVGAAATITVFPEIGFTGASRQFSPGSRLTRLDDALSANIESIQMSCKGATP
jgi:hypothetical protein